MSAIDDLPPLREVIRQHALSARKSLGQNFLLDLNLTARIARAAGPLDDATVIEIGPGPGGLTRALLALGARRVIAVERDQRALPADTMFHEAARKTYDCAICMYHDQALIPVKTLAFDDAVNVTLGLPFIRTSPDHGTAFDIAGTGKADPSSLIAALRLAARMAATQPT